MYPITHVDQVSAQTKQTETKNTKKTKVTDFGHLTFFAITPHRHNQSAQMIYQNFPQHIPDPKNTITAHIMKAAKLQNQKTPNLPIFGHFFNDKKAISVSELAQNPDTPIFFWNYIKK